jgi:hypothetical protein
MSTPVPASSSPSIEVVECRGPRQADHAVLGGAVGDESPLAERTVGVYDPERGPATLDDTEPR